MYQSPTTGMFPHDLSQPGCVESHVRDSIYCATAIWALSQAFKRIDDDKGKTLELAQSAVKCMRGILACWMRQADKVEKFKMNQSPKNALHSKFHLVTGDTVTRDEEYEHLQIDCVALYLIFLVQMITSGLQIIFTTDEVNFVQNLVFYVERAYRTTDFGMWERGSKYNNGSSELHASSVGMAKAALESIGGENMFGLVGSYWSTIYVGVDTHHRNQMTFNTLLPRESASKNTDASLLPTVSWPAFAIHEETLARHTLDKITRKLKGNYGFKRFLRDGRYTMLEDRNRKYYRPEEIKTFDGIECQWPLFAIYFLIDSIFRRDKEQIEHYQNMVKSLVKQTKEGPIVPKYYYVSMDCIEAERAKPGSQKRVASSEGTDGNIFLWGQSVYIISQLLVEGLLNVNELDPIRRHLPAAERPRPNSRYSSFQRGSSTQSSPSDLVIQVALISESVRLQQMLSTYGIQTQTPHQVDPIQIWPPCELAKAYEQLGVNQKLGLSGRPPRPVGGLGTGKIYRACGSTVICYPLLFETSDFYLCQDMRLVLDDVKTDLAFLSKCWKLSGRPTFCMIIREDNLRGPNARYIFQLLAQFKRGDCDGIKVRLGRLQEFISSACIEHLDFLTMRCAEQMSFQPFVERSQMTHAFRSLTNIAMPAVNETETENWIDTKMLNTLSNWELSQNVCTTADNYVQMQILEILLRREGLYFRMDDLTVEERLESLCRNAGNHQQWAVVRFGASLLGKVVDSLAPSITSILVRGKQVTIGVFGHEEEVIEKPISPQGIKHILYSKCFPHDIIQAVLQQELLLNIGKFITTNPKLFDGILKIRIGWVVQALKLELTNCSGEDASLNVLSPSAIKSLLLQVLSLPTSKKYSNR
ncbi:hypothetical protein NP493_65g06037 [Ridgeia piscesae]|uniref:Phosphorylase b kinase regulatory subunit n=1 Tax=Ridgeia piscesae TaxID=27915 RepID=A0AAD9UIL7_RIDPI|nr:hypothetical protein NP493_65g06037 [Ridgeia piscesae]